MRAFIRHLWKKKSLAALQCQPSIEWGLFHLNKLFTAHFRDALSKSYEAKNVMAKAFIFILFIFFMRLHLTLSNLDDF